MLALLVGHHQKSFVRTRVPKSAAASALRNPQGLDEAGE
jgi:hypothetical protein